MKRFALIALSLCLSMAAASAADWQETVRKARAHLGSEEALNSLKSLQYFGQVSNGQGEEIGAIELIFERPRKQRQEITHNREGLRFKEIIVLNRNEGYVQQVSLETGQPVGMRVLSGADILRLQSNTAENLFFFRGPLHESGTISDGGLVEDFRGTGATANKLIYSYPNSAEFHRYFDAETGELLGTVDVSNRVLLIESGELAAGSLTLPQKVHTFRLEGVSPIAGEELMHVVSFDKIFINESFNAATFAFPERF